MQIQKHIEIPTIIAIQPSDFFHGRNSANITNFNKHYNNLYSSWKPLSGDGD